MKIVILEAAHNKNGMTLALVNSFIDGVKSADSKAEIKQHDLLNENIEFCRGCNQCVLSKVDNPKCVINDVCEDIKKEALEADVVVLATPIYEYAVSSSMKRFLERCLSLATFKFGPAPRFKSVPGKVGVVICSSGAPFPFNHLMGITRYPKRILKLACRMFRCSKIEMIFAGGMAVNEKMKNKWLARARSAGYKIAKVQK